MTFINKKEFYLKILLDTFGKFKLNVSFFKIIEYDKIRNELII